MLAFAVEQGRAVLSINRKRLIRLHRETPEHAGIAVCTYDPDFVAQAERIDAFLQTYPDLTGLLLRVHRPPR